MQICQSGEESWTGAIMGQLEPQITLLLGQIVGGQPDMNCYS